MVRYLAVLLTGTLADRMQDSRNRSPEPFL